MPELSTKPYLIRALYEWCTDSGLTPYLAVAVGEGVLVPQEYVKNGEIVLNISPLATNRLKLGNEAIEFQARFGGVGRDIHVPLANVLSIYARENGQGMAFEAQRGGAPAGDPAAAPAPASTPTLAPVPARAASLVPLAAVDPGDNRDEPPPVAPTPGDRPRLTRIK